MHSAMKRAPKIRKIQRVSDVAPKPDLAPPSAKPVLPMPAGPVDPVHQNPIWHVWVEGTEPVGPVTADQIARGIKAGKIPSEASIRRDDDPFWSDLFDVPAVVSALKSVTDEDEPPPPSSMT